jgi:hypothetical protein
LDDTKALAAKARSQTGGPVLVPNAAELSGVRPRRDSVIGARLTPPPRASSSEMPNWVWGVLGCLTVLLVGSVALFALMRGGMLGALVGERAPAVVAAPPAAPGPVEPAPAAEPAPAPEPAAPVAAEAPSRPARRAPAEEPPQAPAPEPAAPVAAAAPAEEEKKPAREKSASRPAAKPAEEPAAAPEGEGEAVAEAKPEPKPRAARAAAAAPKAPAEGEAAAEDDATPPGQDEVEAALDALATRVRGCFVKYQIKGTARVRLVATPAGAAESVSVTGEFEDTPTGLCVESVVASAKLPTFKGPALKLSQSYQLR